MGKRKQIIPQRATDEKRKCMTWNMLDSEQNEQNQGEKSDIIDLTLDDEQKQGEACDTIDLTINKGIAESIPWQQEELVETEIFGTGSNQNSKCRLVKDDVKKDIFELHIENSLFYVIVLQKPKLKDLDSWFCVFGEINVTFSPSPLFFPLPIERLPESENIKLYINQEGEKGILSFEIFGKMDESCEITTSGKKKGKKRSRPIERQFWLVDVDFPVKCCEMLKCKNLQVVVDKFDTCNMCLTMKIIGTEGILSRLKVPSEAVLIKGQNLALTMLMEHFYRIKAPCFDGLPYTKKHDIEHLYSVVKEGHRQTDRATIPDIQHPDLLPWLRPYQQDAITWMLQQERDEQQVQEGDLHMLYTEIQTKDKKTLYYNKYAGILLSVRPTTAYHPPGGILGDEMGLGKTVEVLGCMLHHTRQGITLPNQLPVIQVEPKDKPAAKKKSKMKKKTTETSNISPPVADSEATINYSDIVQSNNVVDDGLSKTDGSKAAMVEEQINCTIQDNNQSMVLGVDNKNKSIPNFNQSEYLLVSCDSNTKKIKLAGEESKQVVSLNSNCQNDEKACNEKEKETYKSSEANTETSHNQTPMKYQEADTGTSNSTTQGIIQGDITGTTNLSSRTSNTPTLGTSETLTPGTSQSPTPRTSQTPTPGTSQSPTPGTSNDQAAGALSNTTQENPHYLKQGTSHETLTETTSTYQNTWPEPSVGADTEFECVCGGSGHTRKKHPVQCVQCNLWQHAECVNYDLQDPYRGEFKCPHCHVSSPAILSGATLIISPFSIANQWVDEIMKHVANNSLNVFMYSGVNKQGFIQPQTLARQDIVITTYETLRKEIDYVDLPHNNSENGRKLRHPKRFMAIPSPITAVEWWRICLDEAQMVECTTTKTAEMALRLSAVNRWCVTGTPIQKGIQDLYGLMLFLGVDPYWVQQWWNKLVYNPYCHGVREPMYDLLTSVLWRTVKQDVLDQIDIPTQTEHVNWLTFSPVEEHFYRRQYRDCVKLSMERLSKWTDSSMRLSSLDRHTVSQLLYPLLRLRQACCHPQAVRGEFIPIQKSTMTMEELLESLTKKAKLEAEESHRALVAAINGEAGLYIIQQDFVMAVEKYREVLRSVEEHKNTLHTDSLQQLHAMYNLHEVLSSKPAGVDPTLRDHQLKAQIDENKDKYMAKAITYVKGTEEALAPAQVDVKQLTKEFNDGSEWWLEVIQGSLSRGQDDLLVTKVRDDLLDNRNPNINNLVRSCKTAVGLQYALEIQLSGLQSAHKQVVKAMKGLHGKPSIDLINKTVECCLRPVAEILKTCPFCKSEELFENYETKLFSFVDKGVESTSDQAGFQVNVRRQGTWADSELDKALKSILSFAKSYRVEQELIEYGTMHLKLLDAMKKEFKRMRTHWAGIKEHVGSFDEVDMCTTRLRVRLPEEPTPETPQPNILEPAEVAQHKLKLASDRIVAQGEVRKKLGQLLYLKNLAKNQSDNKGGDNPDPCPICQQELGKEWSVMQCGHCYCIECIRILVERASFGRRSFSVKCAVCRQSTHQGEISYVTTKQRHQSGEGEHIRVQGSHSTKVEAIVQCLLKIKREDPKAKSLVFSTWTDVLSVIATALGENGIQYKALYTAGKFQQNLSAFKQYDDVTTLLLPVHSGANGLNLIEASHVLLVEPILNTSQELQAIGRVHRIGQTKPTCVHRFLIRATIEQKMQVLLKSMDKHGLTKTASEESALTIGDLSSLFVQQVEQLDEQDGDGEATVTEMGNSDSPQDIPSVTVEDAEQLTVSDVNNRDNQTTMPSIRAEEVEQLDKQDGEGETNVTDMDNSDSPQDIPSVSVEGAAQEAENRDNQTNMPSEGSEDAGHGIVTEMEIEGEGGESVTDMDNRNSPRDVPSVTVEDAEQLTVSDVHGRNNENSMSSVRAEDGGNGIATETDNMDNQNNVPSVSAEEIEENITDIDSMANLMEVPPVSVVEADSGIVTDTDNSDNQNNVSYVGVETASVNGREYQDSAPSVNVEDTEQMIVGVDNMDN